MTDDPTNVEHIERLSEAWWASRSAEVRARRCRAHRRNGDQCAKVAMEAQHVCGTHGGRAPQAKAKARRRIDEAADRMAARLLGFAENENVPAYVALAAVQDALDRAGLKAPTQVEVDVKQPYEELLEGVAVTGVARITRAESREHRGLPALGGLTDPDAPIDAEVVEDPARDMGAAPPDIDGEPPKGERRGFRPDPASATGPSRGLVTMEEAVADQRKWISSCRIRRAR